jgi:hypothetical protein
MASCKILGSDSGGYEELCLVGYNAMFQTATQRYIPEDRAPHGVTSQRTAQLQFESHKVLNLFLSHFLPIL